MQLSRQYQADVLIAGLANFLSKALYNMPEGSDKFYSEYLLERVKQYQDEYAVK